MLYSRKLQLKLVAGGILTAVAGFVLVACQRDAIGPSNQVASAEAVTSNGANNAVSPRLTAPTRHNRKDLLTDPDSNVYVLAYEQDGHLNTFVYQLDLKPGF